MKMVKGKRKLPLSQQPAAVKKGRSAERPLIIPTSDRLHTQTISKGHRRDFYDGVQIDVPEQFYDEDYVQQDGASLPSRWSVNVGDLVAVHCDRSSEPEKKIYSRKSIWYPFTKPWSPGQVVSIYQDFKDKGQKGGENMQMQIRWLYRREDLIKEDDHFEQELEKCEHNWRMIYETDVIDEYNVDATLGKIVLTTYPHSERQGKYQDPKTFIPQMTHVCQFRVGKKDEIESVKDWDHYNDWESKYRLPAALLRGLESPASYSHKDKVLKKVQIKAIYERWREAEREKERQTNAIDVTNCGSEKSVKKKKADAVPASLTIVSRETERSRATGKTRPHQQGTVDLMSTPKPVDSKKIDALKTAEKPYTPHSLRSAGGASYRRSCTPKQFFTQKPTRPQRVNDEKTAMATTKTISMNPEKLALVTKEASTSSTKPEQSKAIATRDRKPRAAKTATATKQEEAKNKAAKPEKATVLKRKRATEPQPDTILGMSPKGKPKSDFCLAPSPPGSRKPRTERLSPIMANMIKGWSSPSKKKLQARPVVQSLLGSNSKQKTAKLKRAKQHAHCDTMDSEMPKVDFGGDVASAINDEGAKAAADVAPKETIVATKRGNENRKPRSEGTEEKTSEAATARRTRSRTADSETVAVRETRSSQRISKASGNPPYKDSALDLSQKPKAPKRQNNRKKPAVGQHGAVQKPDKASSRKESDGDNEVVSTGSELSDVDNVAVNVGSILYLPKSKAKTKRVEYFKSFEVEVQTNEIAPKVLSNRSGIKQMWTVSVGDVVCLQCPQSSLQANHILAKNKHRSSKEARMWYPFVTPWSVCQILSIRREVDTREKNSRAGKVELEIRWFYRESDLPTSLADVLPFQLDEHVEEIFETDYVQMSPASAVLGGVELLLGDTSEGSEPINATDNAGVVPTVRCRCRRFSCILPDRSALMPQMIFNNKTDPKRCFRSTLSRCLKISERMSKDGGLKAATETHFGLSRQSKIDSDGASSQVSSQPKSILLPQIKRSGREYFESVSITPPWDNYLSKDLIWPEEDRPGDRLWTVRVGDVVALHLNESTKPTYAANRETMWSPFSVPWSPCQILAIFRNVPEEGKDEAPSMDVMVEVRWLYRQHDLPKGTKISDRMQSRSKVLKLELLFGTDYVEAEPQNVDSLLGPLHLVSVCEMRDGFQNDSSSIPPFMPTALQVYGGEYSHNKRSLKSHDSFLPDEILERATQHSTHYQTKKLQKQILEFLLREKEGTDVPCLPAALGYEQHDIPDMSVGEKTSEHVTKAKSGPLTRQSLQSAEVANSTETSTSQDEEKLDHTIDEFISENRGEEAPLPLAEEEEKAEATFSDDEPPKSTSSISGTKRVGIRDPFHVDVSSMTSFYEEVHISPPYSNYSQDVVVGGEKNSNGADESSSDLWTVKMGDIVIVHWDGDSGRRDNIRTSHDDKFLVRTSVGEVITILRTHGSKKEMQAPGNKAASIHFPEEQDSIKTEVRWLYRKCELPGSALSMGSVDHLDDQYEEVLETDAVDVITASSLLAPANLHSEANNNGASDSVLGMPVCDFHCRRFWSIHRRSLLPCGSMSGMKERGWMHSQYFGKNQVLRAAIDSPSIEAKSPQPVSRNAVANRETMSHRDAFRKVIMQLSLIDASEATNVRGLRLTGREKEQDTLISFLRKAICSQGSVDNSGPEQRPSSLFVAGPPGTGKTASVRSAVERLRHEQARGDVPEFDFIYLNGMEMRHPFEAYVKLWESLSGTRKEKLSPGAAAAELEKLFTESNGNPRRSRKTTILLLDEIDYLVTRKQTVLYNFFDWPIRTAETGNGNRLVVVGISNTVNLPERLKPSVQSRLGSQRCDFRSYKVDEMVKILKIKIDVGNNSAPAVFDEDAILFAARKTAALSGDFRKALQICKSAAETVLKEFEDGNRDGPPVVRIRDVQNVSREANSSISSKAVSLSTPFEALLLVSLASLTCTSGRRSGGFDIKEVMTKVESVAAGSGDSQYMPPPTFGETLDMLNRLGEARLVTLHTPKSSATTFRAAQGGSGGAWPLISLPLESSNILTALRDTSHGQLAEKYLGRTGTW